MVKTLWLLVFVASAQVLAGDSRAELTSDKPLPAAVSRLRPTVRRAKNPFDGIDFFSVRDRVRRFIVGEPGQPGYLDAEYCARTGDFRCTAIDRNTQGNPVKRIWRYNQCNGTGSFNQRGPIKNRSWIGEENFAAAQRDLDTICNALSIPPAKIGEEKGYPEVDSVVEAIMRRKPISAHSIPKGSLVLIRYGRRADSEFNLMRVTGFGDEYIDPDLRYLPLLSNGLGLGPEVAGKALKIRKGQGVSYWGGTNPWPVEKTLTNVCLGKVGEAPAGSDESCVIWRVSKREAAAIAKYRPEARGPRSKPGYRSGLATYAALQSMQYDRWFLDEIDYETRDSAERKRSLLSGRYKDATPTNYGRALEAIIERFGERSFVREVTELFASHLNGLHTKIHLPDSPYKPHSDIRPLAPDLTYLGYQTIRGRHPVPMDMRDSGLVVNAKTLFGDKDFWLHVADNHPFVFNKLVDWLKQLPSEYEQRGTYDTALLNPIGLIKHYFPDAFEVVNSRRRDFDSPVSKGEALRCKFAPLGHDPP